MIAATNDAKKSLEGNDAQTPFKLKKRQISKCKKELNIKRKNANKENKQNCKFQNEVQ